MESNVRSNPTLNVFAPMPARSSVKRSTLRFPLWMWAVSFGLLYTTMAATMFMMRAPGLLDRPLTDPEPARIAMATPDEEAKQDVLDILDVAGRAKIDADGFTQLVRPWHDRRLEGLRVSVSPEGYAVFDISLRKGASWINIHLVASELEMQAGQFTRLVVRDLQLSGWDLKSIWGERDLAIRANEELELARTLYPATGRMLDALRTVEFVEGQFMVDVGRADVTDAFHTTL
jgi:hypothetical protein